MDIKKRKLLIIGNGFDLAHNLPTSYKSFIEFTMKDFFEKSSGMPSYNENIFFFSSFLHRTYYNNDVDLFIKKIGDFVQEDRLKVKNELFLRILKTNLKNWVDIESFYYKELIKNFNRNKASSIEKLNKEFSDIKFQFIEYLNEQVANIPITKLEQLSLIFKEHVYEFDNPEIVQLEKDAFPIHILNFNYTSTIEEYTKVSQFSKITSHNYIHGDLRDVNENIIFGYGDETDENYLIIEKAENNEYLKHFKSFGYFKTENYQRLLRFLDFDKYDVLIMGHSCGLSDRVMLKTIFEHKNCEEIQIFYHQKGEDTWDNDFVEKTMEISRHFSDKAQMRKKVRPFNLSIPLTPYKPEK